MIEWEFRCANDPESFVNAAVCAIETDGVIAMQPGWAIRAMEAVSGDGCTTIIVYVEQPNCVTSTILYDGSIIDR